MKANNDAVRGWSKDEEKRLIEERNNGLSWAQIAELHNRTADSVRSRFRYISWNNPGLICDSGVADYEQPLTIHGDALIIGDAEFPFHHAEFINNCIEVAKRWKIKNCILGGDMINFHSLSRWGKEWRATQRISYDAEKALIEFANKLPLKYKAEFSELIGTIGVEADNIEDEIRAAGAELRKLSSAFDNIYCIMGNHEARLLRAIDQSLSPGLLLGLLGIQSPKWSISPYYHARLISGGVLWQIEHPVNSAKGSAKKLAAKYHSNIIMLHNHHYSIQTDPSGQYIAAEIGCAVDEGKLPYASQRHNGGDRHVVGAAIVRNGYLWPLNRFSDWGTIKQKMGG